MSDLELLVEHLKSEPDDTLILAMCTDLLMEEQDMPRGEADLRLARIVQPWRDARRIAEAVALLQEGTRSRRILLTAMYRECGVHGTVDLVVVATAGREIVLHHPEGPDVGYDRYWGSLTISVGAEWVLTTWVAHVAAHSERRRVARRRAQH